MGINTMFKPLLSIFCFLFVLVAGGEATNTTTVIVTGASGRTGSILYKLLKEEEGYTVRALVHNVTKAREVINCTKCDATEGVYVGDVTNITTLTEAFSGVDVLADLVSGGGSSEDEEKAVEYIGVMNQVQALMTSENNSVNGKYVVMCSSMGTTNPKPAPFEGGTSLFWKLNAEAFVMSSGAGFAIIKPGGLMDSECCQKELITGHNDDLLKKMPPIISRADVARIMKYLFLAGLTTFVWVL